MASVACYLSLYLNVPLPRDIIFLGAVHYDGGLLHPLPMNEHYLDFCVREGFRRIVGPTDDLAVLRDAVAKKECYRGKIELIGLDDASEIIPKLFKVLLQNQGGAIIAA